MRSTHTYVIMDLSEAAYNEIREKMVAADYGHAIDGKTIDMHGIAVEPGVSDYLFRMTAAVRIDGTLDFFGHTNHTRGLEEKRLAMIKVRDEINLALRESLFKCPLSPVDKNKPQNFFARLASLLK